jgi:hypothetical protein
MEPSRREFERVVGARRNQEFELKWEAVVTTLNGAETSNASNKASFT